METVVIGFIVVVAILVVGSIVFAAGKGLSEWSSNNAQPVLNVPAKIVARRTNVSVSSHHHHHDSQHAHHHSHTSTSTQYYATFELESGERLEFRLPEKEAGVLLEGDQGELTYQGTRYHGFARQLPSGALAGRKNKTQPLAPLSGACCVRCDTPLHAGSNQCPACNWTQPA